MTTKLPSWVMFAQKNPNDPLAASQRYLNFVPVMPGWNASYSSMAIKENEPRIKLCYELLQFLKGNEDADNTRIWHILTLQSGFNILNPEVFLYDYIITDDQLNLAI
ncbi:MAG: hypothetical protein GY861_25685 [bacterium]|nr:hypothetical protein [bacterium]